MIRRLFALMILGIVATVSAQAAEKLEIGGVLITEYRDRQGGNGLAAAVMQTNTQHGQFRFVQANINLREQLSDYTRFAATMVTSGGGPIISEGWLEFAGFPYDGVFTLGRFYKPLGAPVQTANLSIPALMFHASPVVGMKLGMEYYPWLWEIGVVNNNALSSTGTFISNSRAFARPATPGVFAATNDKEIYAMLGWRDGGEWGSLDVHGILTEGEMSQADQNLLNGLAIISSPREGGRRRSWDFAADYQYGPWRVYGEYVLDDEGRLSQHVWNAGASYRVGKFNYAIGYDRLTNNTSIRPMFLPESWERKRYTGSVTYDYTNNLQFLLEYEHGVEFMDVTPYTNDGLDNDAVIFQVMASF